MTLVCTYHMKLGANICVLYLRIQNMRWKKYIEKQNIILSAVIKNRWENSWKGSIPTPPPKSILHL